MSAPSSTTWPNGISADQNTLEHASHVFYRDAVLLLSPRAVLPADLTSRLRALDCNLHRATSTREFVDGVRSNDNLQKPGKQFYNKYMKNMLHVMDLICRLENLRDVEQDMKTRLRGRLGQVRLVRRADEMGGL